MARADAIPPSPAVPFWRDGNGQRTTVALVAGGESQASRRALMLRHADAICEIVHAAAEARLGGRDADARTLASHASKLCGELSGLWPAGSHQPLA